MRFVFLTLGYHPDQVGGAYRYVTEVATRLVTRGHDVVVIYPAPDATMLLEEERQGVHLRRYPQEEGLFWNNWRQENEEARELLLAHATASDPAATLTILCHAYFTPAVAGVRYVSLFTGPWAKEFRFSRQAAERTVTQRALDAVIAARLSRTEKRALRNARAILTLSEYYRKQLPKWHGGGLPPVSVIFGGVNREQFFPVTDRPTLRLRLRVAPDEFLFVTVRRLDPRMGLLALVEAFAQISTAFPRARWCLIGSGPQSEELQTQINARDLGRQIKLLGWLPDAELAQWLNAADCTVMPSLDLEGFGLATVESLACGTPVLGSSAGATPELIAPLGEQMLYPAGSTEALVKSLTALLTEPKSMPARAQCHDYAVSRFGWDQVITGIEQCAADLQP